MGYLRCDGILVIRNSWKNICTDDVLIPFLLLIWHIFLCDFLVVVETGWTCKIKINFFYATWILRHMIFLIPETGPGGSEVFYRVHIIFKFLISDKFFRSHHRDGSWSISQFNLCHRISKLSISRKLYNLRTIKNTALIFSIVSCGNLCQCRNYVFISSSNC